MDNKKKFQLGTILLVVTFVSLSIYQIYYVAHLPDMLHLDYGSEVTFEEMKERLDREMDQLWLIDIAQVVFATLVALGLFMRLRFIEVDLSLYKAFETEKTEEKTVRSNKEKKKESRITNPEKHKRKLATLTSDLSAFLDSLSMASLASSALIYKLEENELVPVGSFATEKKYSFYNTFRIGVGIVGEVAKSQSPIVINNVQTTDLKVSSGLGSSLPSQIIIMPLVFDDLLVGVVELSYLKALTTEEESYVAQLCTITTVK